MAIESKRLLLEIDREIRRVNREVINPEIPELELSEMNSVMQMVAIARADYLKLLFAISKANPKHMPIDDDVARLRSSRLRFEELLAGARALQTAIERDYLDIKIPGK